VNGPFPESVPSSYDLAVTSILRGVALAALGRLSHDPAIIYTSIVERSGTLLPLEDFRLRQLPTGLAGLVLCADRILFAGTARLTFSGQSENAVPQVDCFITGFYPLRENPPTA
jgi:hypothetical protein